MKAEDGKSYQTDSEIVRPEKGLLPIELEEQGREDTPLEESEEAQESKGIKTEEAPSAKKVEEMRGRTQNTGAGASIVYLGDGRTIHTEKETLREMECPQ